jgi:hypothetical protein
MEATAEVTTTTPATTTESAPAAPATSAPDSSSTTSERPTTVTQLAAHMAKLDLASSATDKAPSAVPAAAATSQPANVQPASVTPAPKQGPIPFDVHSTALENARTKTRAEVMAEVERDLGWARQVSRESLTNMSQIATQINTDPVGFLNRMAAELANHPTYGPQLRSSAGRTLAGGAATSLDPDVTIVDDKGQPVGKTFSAERVQAIVKQAVSEAIGREVQPLKSEYEQRQAAEKTQANLREINEKADTAIARMTEILDGRNDLWAHVDALLAQGKDPIDSALAVRKQHIVPGQTKSAEAAAADMMKRKAAGNTANGAGTSTATTARPKNPKELAAFMENLERAGSR